MANSTKQKMITREGYEVPWMGSDRRISASSSRSGRAKFWSPRIKRLMFAESNNEHLFLYWLESKYREVSFYDTQPITLKVDSRSYTPDIGVVTSSGQSLLIEIKDFSFEPSEEWVEHFTACQAIATEQGFERLSLIKIDKSDKVYSYLSGLYQFLKFFDYDFASALPNGFEGTVNDLWESYEFRLPVHKIYASMYYGFINTKPSSYINLNTSVWTDHAASTNQLSLE